MNSFEDVAFPRTTPVWINHFHKRINPRDNTLFIGSCFSNNIGSHLEKCFHSIYSNPTGIVYNPISLFDALQLLLDKTIIHENELFMHNDLYSHLQFSTLFSDPVRKIACNKMNENLNKISNVMSDLNYLFLTFGTAWVYEFNKTGQVVSNCHKLPKSSFTNRLLNIDNIVNTAQIILQKIINANPDIQIIFTVSPIRHWKNGAHQNSTSKSILHLCILELQKIFPENSGYFPAYEIQMDELRDYRYYDDDMLHPSNSAVKYIRKRFYEAYLDEESKMQVHEMENLFKMIGHRILFPQSRSGKTFKQKTLHQISKLENKFHLDLSKYK